MTKPSNLSFAAYIRAGLRRHFGHAGSSSASALALMRYHLVYLRFQQFTMLSPPLYRANLSIVEKARLLSGCVVECGVWRGGMIAGMASILGSNRDYHLFDSFQGLPPAKEIDGQAAMEWQSTKGAGNYLDNCAAEESYALSAMSKAGVPSARTHLHKGWFDQTVPSFRRPGEIAVLRLDGDWYDSTMVCLESLFDQLTPGGVVILDDYYTWDGCSRALHDFLSKRKSSARIQSMSGVCFLEKPQSDALEHAKQ